MGGLIAEKKMKASRSGSMMAFVQLEDMYGVTEVLVFPKVYEKYSAMLVPDELVILEGKLSFREDEDPKMLVDSVRRLDRRNAETRLKPAKEMHEEIKADQNRAREARQAAAREAAQPQLSDAQLAKQAQRKLYLLLPSRADMQDVKNWCSDHPGEVPVYQKLQDEGIVLLLSREFWCDGSPGLIQGFQAMFGDKGVVMR